MPPRIPPVQAPAVITKCPRPLPCNACKHSRKKCDLNSPCAGCIKKNIECCYTVGPTRYNRKKEKRSSITEDVSSSGTASEVRSPSCLKNQGYPSAQSPSSTYSGVRESRDSPVLEGNTNSQSPVKTVNPTNLQQITADHLLQNIQSDLTNGYDSLASLLESQTRPILYQRLDSFGDSLMSTTSKLPVSSDSKDVSNLKLVSDIHGHSSLHGTYNASICLINSPFLMLTAQPSPNGSMCAIFSGVFESVSSAFAILDLASRLLEVADGNMSLLDSTPLVVSLSEAATVFWFLLCRTQQYWWSIFQSYKLFDRCKMREGLRVISKLLASFGARESLDNSVKPIVTRVASMVCETELALSTKTDA